MAVDNTTFSDVARNGRAVVEDQRRLGRLHGRLGREGEPPLELLEVSQRFGPAALPLQPEPHGGRSEPSLALPAARASAVSPQPAAQA